MGGTGNQFFQYAAGRRLAHKWNTELKLDLSFYEQDKLRPYTLNLFNVQENIATAEEIQRLKKLEETFDTFMPEILNCPDNVWLKGYWSHEEYFADIADILRREFTLKNPLSESARRWKEKILSCECSVSMHFRHGDFIYSPINVSLEKYFAVPPPDYYYNCVEILKRENKNLTVFIFSDNLKWCKENLHFDVPTEFVEGDGLQDVEELYLMSLCKHNIIPKSTFSWWAAWLNQYPDKKVYTPPSQQNLLSA